MIAFGRSWQARSPGERRGILVLAALAAAALLAALWIPVERSRAQLARDLPALRASIAGLERDAAEVKRLRALPARAGGTDAASPLASLATNGGGLAGARIVVLDERRVQVSGEDVAYGALLEWLGNAAATHGMRVESARLDALPAPGRVRAELLLTRS